MTASYHHPPKVNRAIERKRVQRRGDAQPGISIIQHRGVGVFHRVPEERDSTRGEFEQAQRRTRDVRLQRLRPIGFARQCQPFAQRCIGCSTPVEFRLLERKSW